MQVVRNTTNTENRPYIDEDGKVKNPNGQIFAYARVSTNQQNLSRQIIALTDYGVDINMIFMDKESGKNLNRPAYKKLIRCIRRGDLIVIKSIDRLGRNYDEIIDQWKMITVDIGCGIHVLDMPMLNTAGDSNDVMDKFINDMMLQVLSFVAENERKTTISRQQEGIKAAFKKQRTRLGRPRKKLPFDFWEVYLMYREKKYKSTDLWRFCQHMWGMTNRTYYRRINELEHRFGDIPVEKLRNMIMTDEIYDGIEFSIERLEKGIDYYNHYCSYIPEKAARASRRQKERERLAELGDSELERELRETLLAERRKRFHEMFGIRDENGAVIGIEEELADEKKKKEKKKEKKITKHGLDITGFENESDYYRNNHGENSGFNDAVDLINTDPIIPEDIVLKKKEDDGILKPVRTVIIT